MLPRGQEGTGTTVEFNGTHIGQGSLSAKTDFLRPLTSQGAPILIVVNGEKGSCTKLKNSELFQAPTAEGSVSVECFQDGVPAGVIRVNDMLWFSLEFKAPTVVRMEADSAEQMRIHSSGEQQGLFTSSVEIDVTNGNAQPSTQCAKALSDAPTEISVLIKVFNNVKETVTFKTFESDSPYTLIPWIKNENRGDLCIFFELEGEESKFTTRYQSGAIDLNSQYQVQQVSLSNADGLLNVAGSEKTLLRTEKLKLESKASGILSVVDERLSLSMPKVVVADKSTVSQATSTTGTEQSTNEEDSESQSLLRNRLEIWPPYVQTMVGLFLAGLGIQVVLRLMTPRVLRGDARDKKEEKKK